MSTTVNVNGTAYTLPTTGDSNWSTQVSAFFVALAESCSAILTFGGAAFSPAGTFYLPAGFGTSLASEVVFPVPYAGVLQQLRVKCGTAPTVATAVVTVRKNGSDTALTATVGISATTASDTTHQVSVAAGDTVSVKLTNAGATGPINVAVTLALTPA